MDIKQRALKTYHSAKQIIAKIHFSPECVTHFYSFASFTTEIHHSYTTPAFLPSSQLSLLLVLKYSYEIFLDFLTLVILGPKCSHHMR